MAHKIPKKLRSSIYLMSLLLLSSCVTTSKDNWPDTLPERDIFVNHYQLKTNPNPTESELNQHLKWIQRFYLGSILYPLGWNDMIELVVDSIDSKSDKEVARVKLENLGLAISNEWAQDNTIRKINSAHIATWGSSMRTAAERDEQLKLINKVEDDVQSLLADQIDETQITRERYYPPEDYDNF